MQTILDMACEFAATVARMDADNACAIARASSEPVAFITGNSHMPPLRAFGRADEFFFIDDDEGALWEAYADAFTARLDASEVCCEAPEWDNALYVVDLRRWEHVEDAEGDSLNDEWTPKQ